MILTAADKQPMGGLRMVHDAGGRKMLLEWDVSCSGRPGHKRCHRLYLGNDFPRVDIPTDSTTGHCLLAFYDHGQPALYPLLLALLNDAEIRHHLQKVLLP